MPYLVLFIGDKYALRSVRDMGQPFIDQKLFKTLSTWDCRHYIPDKWLDLLKELSDDEPFSLSPARPIPVTLPKRHLPLLPLK